MSITSGHIQKLDGAMREYYEAVYRASHAAYQKNFNLSARRAVISDQDLNGLRDRVTALADPINQATFTLDSYAARAIEKAARERATRDTRSGVAVDDGLRTGLQEYTNTLSKEVLAELDNYNAGPRSTRGGSISGELSHEQLLAAARKGDTGMANIASAPSAKRPVPAAPTSADKPTPKQPASPQFTPLEQAMREVLDRGGQRARRDEVMKILKDVNAAKLSDAEAIPQLRQLQQEAIDNWRPPLVAPTNDYALAADVLARKQIIEQQRLGTTLPTQTPAPAAGDANGGAQPAPAGGTTQTTRLGQTEFPYVDPAIQLVLEQEGFTTGGHNTRRFKAGETTMDGARGPKTNAAIIAFKEKYKGEHQFSTMDENLSESDITFIMSKSKDKQTAVTTDLSAAVTKELNEIKATLGANGTANTMLADNALSDAEKDQLAPQLQELANAVGRVSGGLQGDIRSAVVGLVSAIRSAGVADDDAKLPALAVLRQASERSV